MVQLAFAFTLGFLYLISFRSCYLKLRFPQCTSGLYFLIEIDMDGVHVGSFPESDQLDVEGLQRQLETSFFGIGRRLLYLPVVTSTNAFAMQLARERPEEGVVVLTDSQTAGKGRQGRRWVDVSGCKVLLSTLLRTLFPAHLLIMVASLALIYTVPQPFPLTPTI